MTICRCDKCGKAIPVVTEKEMLIAHAKEIAEHCAEHSECNEDCVFYVDQGDHVCMFATNSTPCRWDLKQSKKSNTDFKEVFKNGR